MDARILSLIRDAGEDGSRTGWHIALGLRNAGYGFDTYRAVMTDPLNGCSEWYRELRDGRPRSASKHHKSARGADRALKVLRDLWHKVDSLPEPRQVDVSDVVERCDRVRQAAHERLTGRTRATRLKVVDALCAEALAHRTVRVLAAVRAIALAAGVSRSTAHQALLDLNAAGLIVHRVTSAQANVFELIDCTFTGTDSLRRGVGQVCPKECAPALDVWRHRDLGASGMWVHAALDDAEALRIADIARATGLHRNTVGRRLRDLSRRSLAVEVEPHRWVRGSSDPAQVVGPARGTRKRDEVRFALDREAFALSRRRDTSRQRETSGEGVAS